MISNSWIGRILFVVAAILIVCTHGIPVNKTESINAALRMADILQGPVANSAAEEFDDGESSGNQLNAGNDKHTMDWLTSKIRETLPGSGAAANDTNDVRSVLLLSPDVLETLESFMDNEEDLTESNPHDTSVDSAVAESNFVVRLARALKNYKYFGGKVPETVVLNSVEVVEHTHDQLDSVDGFPQGSFAPKEKPHPEPPIARDPHPSHEPHHEVFPHFHHLHGHRKGYSHNVYNGPVILISNVEDLQIINPIRDGYNDNDDDDDDDDDDDVDVKVDVEVDVEVDVDEEPSGDDDVDKCKHRHGHVRGYGDD